MSATLGAADQAISTVAYQVPEGFGSKFTKSNAAIMMGATAGAHSHAVSGVLLTVFGHVAMIL